MAAVVTDPAASPTLEPDGVALRDVDPAARDAALDSVATLSAKQADRVEYPAPHPSKRVKIYILNDQGHWEDRGTGHVSCHAEGPRDADTKEQLPDRAQTHAPNQSTPAFSIRVISEETGLLTLRAPIRKLEESFYNLQGDTIISWSEEARSHTPAPSTSSSQSPFLDKPPAGSHPVEMALSFADAAGCRDVWEEIARAQETLSHFAQPTALDLASSAKAPGSNGVLSDWDRPPDAPVPWVDDFDPPFSGSGPGAFRADHDIMFGRDSGPQRALDGNIMPGTGTQSIGVTLPPPDRSALESIARSLSEGLTIAMMRERIAAEITENDYIDKLLDLFSQCEDLEDAEGLIQLYHIVKTMFSLGSSAVLDKLLKDHNIMRVVGALEYEQQAMGGPRISANKNLEENLSSSSNHDKAETEAGKSSQPDSLKESEVSHQRGDHVRPQHREFLRSHAKYRSVVEIKNQSVMAKIHQNFRVIYIKDVVLARVLDDVGFTALNSLVYYNNVDIVMHFLHDKASLEELFRKLGELSDSAKDDQIPTVVDLLKFLLELCTLSRALQPNAKGRLFARMFELGIFDVCLATVKHSNGEIQLLGIEVFAAVLHHDQSAVRWHMMNGHMSLTGAFLDVLCSSSDSGVILHVAEILRTLLENESMGAQDRDRFLNEFYEKFVIKLLEPLVEKSTELNDCQDGFGRLMDTVHSHVCDLLSFCVQNHAFRAKYFVLQHNVGAKVLTLLKRGTLYVSLSALRFFRACIGVKDDFYFKYIVKNQLLDPVVEAFLANVEADNLLSSAVMELVDFLQREKVQTLLGYLVDRHPSVFEPGKSCGVFLVAKETYLQLSKAQGSSPEEVQKENAGNAGRIPSAVLEDGPRENGQEQSNPKVAEAKQSDSVDLPISDRQQIDDRRLYEQIPNGRKGPLSADENPGPSGSSDKMTESVEDGPGSPMDIEQTVLSPPHRAIDAGSSQEWRGSTNGRTVGDGSIGNRVAPPTAVSVADNRGPGAVMSNNDQSRSASMEAAAVVLAGGAEKRAGSLSLRWESQRMSSSLLRLAEASSPKDGAVSADSGDSSSDGSRRSPMSTALSDGFEVSSALIDESASPEDVDDNARGDSMPPHGISISTSDVEDRKKYKSVDPKALDGERKRAKIDDD